MNKYIVLFMVALISAPVVASDDKMDANSFVLTGDPAPDVYKYFDNKTAQSWHLVSKKCHERLTGIRDATVKAIDKLYPNDGYQNEEKSAIEAVHSNETFRIKSMPLLVDLPGNQGYLFSDDGEEFITYEVPMSNLLNPETDSKTGMKKVHGLKQVSAQKYGTTKEDKNFGGVTDDGRRMFMYNLGLRGKDVRVNHDPNPYKRTLAVGTSVNNAVCTIEVPSKSQKDYEMVIKENGLEFSQKNGKTFVPQVKIEIGPHGKVLFGYRETDILGIENLDLKSLHDACRKKKSNKKDNCKVS